MDMNSVITKEEYNSIRNLNYDQFCEFLTKFVKLCVEESLKSLPVVLTHLSSQVAYLKDLSDKFYAANKDLGKHRKLMTQVIENVEGKNPGMSYEDVLEIAAKDARKIISEMGKTTDFSPKDLLHSDSKLKEL